jgi:hypothetical protein
VEAAQVGDVVAAVAGQEAIVAVAVAVVAAAAAIAAVERLVLAEAAVAVAVVEQHEDRQGKCRESRVRWTRLTMGAEV